MKKIKIGFGLMSLIFLLAGCSGSGGGKSPGASPVKSEDDSHCAVPFIKETTRKAATSAVQVRTQCGLEEDQFLQAYGLID